jgi:uncharacterized protein
VTPERRFTSIDFPVGVDAGLGRLATETNYVRHVEQLMRQVLLTNPGDRINRPDFGCGVRRMLFAPNSDLSASLVQASVLQALNQWLGSVIKVDDVKTRATNETLEVRIAYLVLARQERRYLNVDVTL